MMTQLILFILFFLVLVFVVVLMIPSKVEISSTSIKIGKLLKLEIFFNSIQDVRLNSKYPKTIRRIHGFDSGDVKKGIFETPDGRKIRLYLYQQYPPFIEVIHNGGLFVFNSPDPNMTEQNFNKLKSQIEA